MPAASADVVVIGGGVMGLHVALKLAHARVGKVVLCERRRFGAGESGKSGAILRQHYSQTTTIRMARESLFEYVALHERVTGGIGLRRPGMVIVYPTRERTALETSVALQRAAGVDVRVLDARELHELEPRARVEDDLIAAHEPEASFVEPARALAAVAGLAREAGAELREATAVADVLVDAHRRVQGVRLADGSVVASRTVVNAGGPWAARLARRLGVELPLSVVRPQQAFFAPPAEGFERHVFADLTLGVYWKHEATGFTRVGDLSYEHDDAIPDPDRYDEGVSDAFVQQSRERLARRFPAYADAVSWGGCGALYTVTPDSQALIGRVPGVDGLLVVSGFSGHGFKLGPSVGRGVVALLAGGERGAFDPAFFAVDRFARGAPNPANPGRGVLG